MRSATSNFVALDHRMELPIIAIFRGGYSGESVISHQSAQRMMLSIDTDRFRPVFITISKEAWTCEDREGKAITFDRGTFSISIGDPPDRIAAALIAIHGSPGEDGKLQGMLEIYGIPFQTGDVLSMAITFSKSATVALLKQQGFPVAPSIMLSPGDRYTDRMAVLGFPVFVKPDRSGSSLGVSKVKEQAELMPALDLAFAESDQVLVEAAVKGRELTCGVIRIGGELRALPICEIKTSREFFDYEAKYHSNDTQEIIPADLPPSITQMIQDRSVAIYKAFNCRGMVRVDHFWTGGSGEDAIVTIELNTVPGFSGASIFPKMIEAAGLSVKEVINALIGEMVGK